MAIVTILLLSLDISLLYGVLVAEQRRHADEARNRARRYRS